MLELIVMKYEILDHTADLCIRVYGMNFLELLENSAAALMDLIVDRETVNPTKEIQFEIKADTKEELLIKMLGEILYLHEVEKLVFKDIEIASIAPYHIAGKLYGEHFDSLRHELELDISCYVP